jgi:EAL domain-containing protein (putative c-di-GMP-specific phosphodiesterase class I)
MGVAQTGGHLVAEGVETEAELETLPALGVDLVQGYYLARPGWPWPEVRPTKAAAALAAAPARTGSTASLAARRA